MKIFAVICNWEKENAVREAGRVAEYLEGKGAVCRLLPPSAQPGSYSDISCLLPDTECVVTIGGDGTLIRAARDLRGKDVPLIGINLGTLGYLTEIDYASIYKSLDRLLEGTPSVEKRMMLSGRLFRGGQMIHEDIALNDIAIGRRESLNLIQFQVLVDGEYLNRYRADGIILSTPTGSTAYNLSAGGPIVAPEASLILLTPVSPHSLINRSIVLPDHSHVTVEILPKGKTPQKAIAAFDGGENLELREGDRIEISRSEEVTRIMKLSHISFLENLRRKMTEN